MMDGSTFVSVIIIAKPNDAGLPLALECFESQTWKQKESVVAESLSDGLLRAKGLYCAVWTTGHRFRPNTLEMLARYAAQSKVVEIRDRRDDIPCYLFFRRAAHLIGTPELTVERVGAGGIVDSPMSERELDFYHSGNIGDIIYSLPFVRAMGGGHIILGPEIKLAKPPPVRERMSEKLMASIRSLLMSQTYITGVSYSPYCPAVDYDLNQFRLFNRGNLVEQFFNAFSVCKDVYITDEQPWLTIPYPIRTGFPIVINRTARWRNDQFDWKRIVDLYRGHLLFVGFEEEYDMFCHAYGSLPYRKTDTLHELAKIIAGCSLFIGNQSTAYAIAEGLKLNTIQETHHDLPNCKFARPNAIYGERNFCYLPPLKTIVDDNHGLWSAGANLLAKVKNRVLTKFSRDDGTRLYREAVDELSRNLDYLAEVERAGVPSVLEQVPWKCGFFEFPESKFVYYNPSFVSFKWERWLITRRALPLDARREFSDTVFWKLDQKLKPVEMVKPVVPQRWASEQWEDGRAIPWEKGLLMNCCNWVAGYTYAGHQHLVRLNQDFGCDDSWEPSYMGNRPMLEAEQPEKNWVFFVHAEKLHFVYSIHPHVVVEIPVWRELGREHVTKDFNSLWRHGEPRGGTPPVRVGDEYFSFFHSSLPWRARNRRYYMGAYAFEAKPPFRITRMSCIPFMAGSEKDPLRSHLPCCVFPAGAFFENKEWLVTFGVNDCRSAWVRIPHDELLMTLRKI